MKNLFKEARDYATSVLKDPFSSSDNMDSMFIHAQKDWNGKWGYSGKIEFKNGDTSGEQRFNGDNLKEVLVKMEAFVKTMDRRKP
jgi:hypothetical protein